MVFGTVLLATVAGSDIGILVESEGYDYARYAAYIDGVLQKQKE